MLFELGEAIVWVEGVRRSDKSAYMVYVVSVRRQVSFERCEDIDFQAGG